MTSNYAPLGEENVGQYQEITFRAANSALYNSHALTPDVDAGTRLSEAHNNDVYASVKEITDRRIRNSLIGRAAMTTKDWFCSHDGNLAENNSNSREISKNRRREKSRLPSSRFPAKDSAVEDSAADDAIYGTVNKMKERNSLKGEEGDEKGGRPTWTGEEEGRELGRGYP